ncbi:MAG: DUF1512 family protein [Methanobacteriaceae archaeon]|nr:DUF1512 family protein [Methanobacteriaceae archaeon]MDP2836807.1 DUF1512 family protein [Methanobacteriaceae archaeon]MDP3033920.1 DUF1512 family protein [Methanobacteriaceae archaeon]MDP3622755.1 DUF1512 family protein [Methanobacteriaceae archaeon]
MIFGLGPLELAGILAFVIILFFLPKIMRIRMISSINRTVNELESIVKEAEGILIKISKEQENPLKDPEESVARFIEFFIVPPMNLDPQGLVKKFDKILELGEDRFKDMAYEITPEADEETKSNIIMVIKATIGLNAVTKLVKHNMEMARKTGNLQIMLSLQMSLPLLMRMVKAQFEGTKSFSEGQPIGDGIGPLIAGRFIDNLNSDNQESDLNDLGDMISSNNKFKGRELTILRAKGPGARVGPLGKIATEIIEKNNISRIISLDATAKLEGEKTGRVAEGVGVVIGGLGIEKWLIEEKATSNDIKIDAIVIKMSPEEAISQMSEEIAESSQMAIDILKKSIIRSPEGSNILIIGVGNSSGIPNIVSDISEIELKKPVNPNN